MSKVLGLDLGTNSIGWALIDEEKNQILGMGSRIFPEGVVNLGEGEGREISKNASRTGDRGVRRQFFRRRLRKKILLRELSKYNMCPLSSTDIEEWKLSKKFPEEKLRDWFALNPYDLRAKALTKELTLEELGRIFYHIIQRRGFQSNSRSASDDNENSVIFKGSEDKIGILKTQQSIASSVSLGAYLNEIAPKDFEPFKQNLERIRNRYTTRQMFVDEFELIWEKQKQFSPELNNELKTVFGGRKKDGYPEDGVLFHQRPLRSQKHLVGKCTFEPNKTKCPISAIPFEKFRIHQWVNTVECNLKKLSEAERNILVEKLFSKDKATFMELRKAIKKADSGYQFNYIDDDKIVGSHTISQLSNKRFFGDKWFEFSEKEQEDIWHVLYFFEDRDKLKMYAIEQWKFDEERADKISRFNLKQGYASLSRKAINHILPFLEQGYSYDIAVAFGGVKSAFGSNWTELKDFELEIIDTNVPAIVRNGAKGGYIDDLKQFLKKEFQFNDAHFKKLYHHSTSIETSKILDKLPVDQNADKEIQSIRNPVVTTALFEIRRLVNELIDDYGKPDQIKIELARDLKVSKTKRHEARLEQKRLERENDRVKKELERHGRRINHESILKYKLWEECNQNCPFTGKPISITQLFSGEVQIEHIHPWSRSLNDSFMNKTLCFADENRAKGNLTPYEFYSKQGEDRWEKIKAQALSCFKNKKEYPNAYTKFKHFVKKNHDDDFVSRQLNDTRYISKEAKNYLGKVCSNVLVAPGQSTANLRHHWGLNSILNDENTKTRDDHRHHAVDALVMACTNRKHLQELALWNSYDRSYELKQFPLPWESFRKDAESKVNQILVSHRKHKPVLTVRSFKTEKNGEVHRNLGVAARGQLHLETIFGKRKSPNSKEAYHVRKPLSILTPAEIPKIVDPKIRSLVYARIEQHKININDSDGKPIIKSKEEKDLFGKLFSEPIYLPNRNGEPVPVMKIRIKKNIGGAEQLKDGVNQHVDLGNNHHILIYKDELDNSNEDVVTLWKAAERKRQNQSIYQLPNPEKDKPYPKEIVTVLEINDMFLLGLEDSDIDWANPNYAMLFLHLFKVQTLSSKFYEFRFHSDSTQNKDTNSLVFKRIQGFGNGKTGWKTFNPIKVRIAPTGKIEPLRQ